MKAPAGMSPRLPRKRARSCSSAAMLTALTRSKKPHQIATGFDQSSHATLIDFTPQALPNAHESVTLPTHKARSSQTFAAAAAARPLSAAKASPHHTHNCTHNPNLPVVNFLFLRSQVVPLVGFAARGVLDGRCRQLPQPRRIAQKAAPAIPLRCQRFDRRHVVAAALRDRRYFGDRRAYHVREGVRAAGTLHPAAHPRWRSAAPLPAGLAPRPHPRRPIPSPP